MNALPVPRPEDLNHSARPTARTHFYTGWPAGYWAIFVVGIVALAILFGPAYLAILHAFGL